MKRISDFRDFSCFREKESEEERKNRRREERIGRRENRGSLGGLRVLAELGALEINASAYTRAYIKEEG